MPKSQVKAKKSRIIKFALFAFLLYVIVSIFAMQVDISKRKAELAAVEQEIQQQEIINQEIKNILNSGEDEDYIMRIAREKFGFVYPDERVFVDITGE